MLCSKRRKKTFPGYTITELIVVIAVLAVGVLLLRGCVKAVSNHKSDGNSVSSSAENSERIAPYYFTYRGAVKAFEKAMNNADGETICAITLPDEIYAKIPEQRFNELSSLIKEGKLVAQMVSEEKISFKFKIKEKEKLDKEDEDFSRIESYYWYTYGCKLEVQSVYRLWVIPSGEETGLVGELYVFKTSDGGWKISDESLREWIGWVW